MSPSSEDSRATRSCCDLEICTNFGFWWFFFLPTIPRRVLFTAFQHVAVNRLARFFYIFRLCKVIDLPPPICLVKTKPNQTKPKKLSIYLKIGLVVCKCPLGCAFLRINSFVLVARNFFAKHSGCMRSRNHPVTTSLATSLPTRICVLVKGSDGRLKHVPSKYVPSLSRGIRSADQSQYVDELETNTVPGIHTDG